jgi:hypothetical protein
MLCAVIDATGTLRRGKFEILSMIVHAFGVAPGPISGRCDMIWIVILVQRGQAMRGYSHVEGSLLFGSRTSLSLCT